MSVAKHGQKYYSQIHGIMTGDNHAVSLANIAVHCIISKKQVAY